MKKEGMETRAEASIIRDLPVAKSYQIADSKKAFSARFALKMQKGLVTLPVHKPLTTQS
jgi:hypothetical protein